MHKTPIKIILDLRCMRIGKNGPSRFSYELLNALMDLNQPHYFIVMLHSEWNGKIIFKPGFTPLFTDSSLNSPFDFIRVRRLAQQYETKLYFSTTFITPPLLLRGNTKKIATIHDLINITLPEYYDCYNIFYALLAKIYLKFRTWLTVKTSDRIVTVSEFSKKEITTHYNSITDKTTVIYNGVNNRLKREALSDSLSRKYSIDGEYFLGIGNFRGYKNIGALLKAYRELKIKGCKELLVLFGYYQMDLAERIINCYLPPDFVKDVRLVGQVPDNELRQIYSNATAFVFPSLIEGFGIPAIEAMACGAPVITSSTGSMPEVCGEAAIFVDPRDPSEIARAMRTLIDDPERRDQLVKAGYRQVKRFDWNVSAKKLIMLFQAV